MPQYNVTGIVLRRLAYGETDNILTLYTRERGRISAIAKGARKPMSRTAGACELLACARYNVASGKSLEVVTQTEVKNSFPALRKDLARMAHGQYIAELVDKFVVYEDPHPELFQLLRATLLLLERTDDAPTAARWFELRLLDEAGFGPDLASCAVCGEAVPVAGDTGNAAYSLSAGQGGVLCPDHANLYPAEEEPPLSLDAVDYLQHLDAHSLENIRAVLSVTAPPPLTAGQARAALRRYIRWRIDSDLRTVAFLDSLAPRPPSQKNAGGAPP